jgi:hypothetical protein
LLIGRWAVAEPTTDDVVLEPTDPDWSGEDTVIFETDVFVENPE